MLFYAFTFDTDSWDIMKFMSKKRTIFKKAKNILSILSGSLLITLSILNFLKNRKIITSQKFANSLIDYVRYYDERVLIFTLIAGSVLIFYGLFYDRIDKDIKGGE